MAQRLGKVLQKLEAATQTARSYNDNGYIVKHNVGAAGAAAEAATTEQAPANGAAAQAVVAATRLTWDAACRIIRTASELANELASKHVDMWKAQGLVECVVKVGIAAAASGKLPTGESSMWVNPCPGRFRERGRAHGDAGG